MAKGQKMEQKVGGEAEVGSSTKAVPRSEQVRQEILEANKLIEENYLRLAKLLSEAYHKDFYQEWQFKDFREYCEAELDIQYRKAMYLVDIWDKVKSLNLSPAKVAKLGWSKMKDIASVMTKENAKDWMDKAEKMTTRDLTEAVKISRVQDASARGTIPHIVTMTFRMGESEHNVVSEALEECKKLCESESPVVALEMICQDWLEMKGVSPTRTSLDDRIKFLESAYGVDITYKPKVAPEVAAEEAATAETEKVLEKAEKKGKARKAKKGNGETEAPEPPEEDVAAAKGQEREQDINTLLGLDSTAT
jgi:hypothetical protein